MVERNQLAGFIVRIYTSEETIQGGHPWARAYLAVCSGNITDEMIQQYIEEHEGEPVTAEDSRFQIDPSQAGSFYSTFRTDGPVGAGKFIQMM